MKVILSTFFLLVSLNSFSKSKLPLDQIGNYVEKELKLNIEGMEEINNLRQKQKDPDNWIITFLRIILKGSVGFELPWIANANVNARLEFYWFPEKK